ncbi:hypothetical protein [Aidingimonas lacisalsi]|uniref:hypothetical protein n=1 Tax=Aidingimonas lacisalsi TaxID=2604086 RepID=UPI0011D291A0|nr:hypothetical protein [Aidingimonas lacisalsi]
MQHCRLKTSWFRCLLLSALLCLPFVATTSAFADHDRRNSSHYHTHHHDHEVSHHGSKWHHKAKKRFYKAQRHGHSHRPAHKHRYRAGPPRRSNHRYRQSISVPLVTVGGFPVVTVRVD